VSVPREEEYRLGWLKWSFVCLIVAAGVYGNWYFAEESLLYRVLALVALAMLALAVASQTFSGRMVLDLLKEARAEIRKVIWPTPQEVTQTTALVLVLVFLVAVILWLLDWSLGSLVEGLIG